MTAYVFSRELQKSVSVRDNYHLDSIRNTFDSFVREEISNCIEIRAFRGLHNSTGFFFDREAFINAAINLSNVADNVYTTINSVNPELLALYPPNKMIGQYRAMKLGIAEYCIDKKVLSTSDSDVEYETAFVIDLDPQRKTDISSSDEQMRKTYDLALDLSHWFDERLVPHRVACSGNGWHIVIRMKPVKITAEAVERRKTLLNIIADKFSTADIHIDRKVFNPARIIKLYGTVARKGINLPSQERYHRISYLKYVPCIEPDLYGRFKSELHAAATNATDYKRVGNYTGVSYTSYDIDKILIAAGIRYRHKKTFLWELFDCPASPGQHKPYESRITQRDNGAVGFSCFHDSCRHYHWKDFRAMLESKGLNLRDYQK